MARYTRLMRPSSIAPGFPRRYASRRRPLAACALSLGLLTSCATTPPGSRPPETASRTSGAAYDHGGLVRGPLAGRQIALLFTGGSYGESTGPILDTLHERGIPAAFFLTGEYLADPAHRPLVRRMLAEGHYVGPHSHAHLLYCSWERRSETLVSREEFHRDLERNIADIRARGGLPTGQPVVLVPPYEWYNEDQVRWAREMGVAVVNFTPGSGSNRDYVPESDARFIPSTRLREDILDCERRDPHGLSGFLLLMHLGSQRQDKMHTQLGELLDELSRRGYSFVRVDAWLAAQAE